MNNREYKLLIDGTLDNYEAIIDDLDIDDKGKKKIKNQWLQSIRLMEHLCRKQVHRDNVSTVALIISSAFVPVLINANSPSYINLQTVATILSIFVAILSGMRQFFKFSDKWKNYRKTSEALKIEGELFFALSNNYSEFATHKDAFKLFTHNVCGIKNEQINEYIQKIVNNDSQQDDSGDSGDDNDGDDGDGQDNRGKD